MAVVRDRGRWLLYDDENVEPVDEADIPRYFGDYPAGAGYVLFYQAVDLDPVALGLAKPPPVMVDEPESMPTTPFLDVDPFRKHSFPNVVPKVHRLNEEPVGAAAAAMSAKEKVQAALADYQAATAHAVHTPAPVAAPPPVPAQPRAVSPPASPIRQNTFTSIHSQAASSNYDSSAHDNNPFKDPVPSSTLGYDPGNANKGDKSGSKWMPKFGGGTKEKDVKSKRNSFYGSPARPPSSTSAAPSVPQAAAAPPSVNGTYTRQRTMSGMEGYQNESNPGSALLHTVRSGREATPPPPAGRAAAPHSTTSVPADMSGSFVSTNTSSSGGQAPASRPVPINPPAPSSQPQRSSPAPTNGSRPGLSSSSTFSGGLSAFGLGSKKEKDNAPMKEKETPRQASGGSLTRKMTLTRSPSAAFKSMLGGGKK